MKHTIQESPLELTDKKIAREKLNQKNKFRGNKTDQKRALSTEQPFSLSAKTSPMRSHPLMTKTHYSFAEAFRFIRSIFSNFTHENLLNHGFQNDITFFIKTPSEIKVCSAFNRPYANWRGINEPIFLILSPFDCEEIERNGSVKTNKYPRGYLYHESSMLIEAIPNYNPKIDSKSHWQTYLNNEIHDIEISSVDLLVTHLELIRLALIIKLKTNHNLDPKTQKDIKKEIFTGHLPKKFKSLINISSLQTDCQPLDILRRAIQRKIILMTQVPPDITIRSSNFTDYSTGIEYLLRPQFMELSLSDCIEIYNNESILKLDFSAGYFYDSLGRIKRITPSNERPWLAIENPPWRSFRGNTCSTLHITYEHIYALSSDLNELIDEDESQDLRIPKETINLLSNQGFISLKRAVEIVKLKHPKCTAIHLLRFGLSKKISITTPIPNGIRVGMFKNLKKTLIPFDQPFEYPVLLNLCIGTLEHLEKNGKSESDIFETSYWVFDNLLRKITVGDRDIWSLTTYFSNNPFKIELTFDNLYTNKLSLIQLINSEPDLWETTDQMIIRDAKIKKQELDSLESKNDAASAANKKDLELLIVDSINHLQNQENGEKSVGILSEISLERDNQLLTRAEVMSYLRIGKSSMYSCMKRASKNYDPDFPQPVGNSSHKKFWVKHEVTTYQEIRMNRRSVSNPVSEAIV